MKKWAILAISLVSVLSFNGFANENKGLPQEDKKAKFEKIKEERIKHMELRLNCIRKANDRQGMQQCDENAKKEAMKQRMQRMDEQQNKIDQKKQRLQQEMTNSPVGGQSHEEKRKER